MYFINFISNGKKFSFIYDMKSSYIILPPLKFLKGSLSDSSSCKSTKGTLYKWSPFYMTRLSIYQNDFWKPFLWMNNEFQVLPKQVQVLKENKKWAIFLPQLEITNLPTQRHTIEENNLRQYIFIVWFQFVYESWIKHHVMRFSQYNCMLNC